MEEIKNSLENGRESNHEKLGTCIVKEDKD